jgi:hypothetical protein
MNGLDNVDRERREATRHRTARQRTYAAETIGLLLISALLLVISIVRYWNHINWSAR